MENENIYIEAMAAEMAQAKNQSEAQDKNEAQDESGPLAQAVESGPEIAAEHAFGAEYATRVRLKKPLARDSRDMQAIDCLYVREPKAGDLRGVKMTDLLVMDVAALLPLMQRVVMPRLSPAEAARLAYADTVSLYGAVNGFLV